MRKTALLIGLTLSIFGFHLSFAQTPTWKNITPAGWSGSFQKVTFTKGGRAIAAANNGWIYQSTDTGKTWNTVFNGFPNKQGYYTNGSTAKGLVTKAYLEFYTDSLNGIYMGNRYNTIIDGLDIAYTSDGGQTWQNTQTNINNCLASGLYWKNIDSVFLCAFNQNTSQMYVYLSTNKGKSWKQTSGLLSSKGNSCQIYFSTPLHGYAFSTYYYGETIDGGNTWTTTTYNGKIIQTMLKFKNGQVLICADDTPKTVFPNCKFTSIQNSNGTKMGASQIADLGFGRLYSVAGDNASTEQIVNFSTDSGKIWKSQLITPSSYSSNTYLYGIAFLTEKIGISVGNNLSSFVTFDGGITWTKHIHGGAEGLNKLFCKTKNECYITGNTGRLFHTIDGGDTWNYKDLYASKLGEIEFPTPDTGYISANKAIFRTIDGGLNWTSFPHNTQGTLIKFPTKDTGYIGFTNGDPYIQKTTDGGETWNYTLEASGGTGIAFRTANEGLMTGSNNLLYTTDGSDNWNVKATGIVATKILPVKDNWLVLNTGNIYLCDKNINCTLKYKDDSYSLLNLISRDSNTIIITAQNDSVLISKDSGITWDKEYFPFYNGQLSFGDKNTLYSLGVNIYKGVFKAQTTSSIFSMIDNQTISCKVTNDAKESYYASIILINNLQDTIIINSNIQINNDLQFPITIPTTIKTGASFKIQITPIDTVAFSTIESQTFTATDIEDIKSSKLPNIKIIGNKIVCDCNDLKIFNTLGQQLQNGSELSNGIYIIKCNNVTQKIIIKP